ncbi:MAG: hypothetical protein K1X47_13810 [Cyclobacteriaceae bacterium]|nr:hypothetical protein [Cyclobacteriaceae bacterium]
METEEGQGKAEKLFKEFGKKVDQFVVELNDSGERLQADFEKKLAELKDAAEKFKKEAENKERWKDVEQNLKRAGEELEQAFKAAFKKRGDKPS